MYAAGKLGEIRARAGARQVRRAIAARAQHRQPLGDIERNGPGRSKEIAARVAETDIGNPPAVTAERGAQYVDAGLLCGKATFEDQALRAGAFPREDETRSHRPG